LYFEEEEEGGMHSEIAGNYRKFPRHASTLG
jgi:hypothetical protein